MKDKRSWAIGLFLVGLMTFAVYFESLQNDFTNWDDNRYVTENFMVRSLTLPNIKKIFTTTTLDTYSPLTLLTFAVEYYFFKYNPFFYHLTNLILHIAVTGLVFLFGWRVGLKPWAAGLAALLFGIHPIHVESVAWITERKDVLYAFFYMLALLNYWQYLERGQKIHYFLCILFGLLSMLSKAMALSLPLILFVCDWMYGRKWTLKVWVEKIPYFFYIIPLGWVTYSLNARLPGRGFMEGVTIWIYSFSFYIQKWVIPIDLNPQYQLPEPTTFTHWPYMIAVGIFGISGVLLIKYRRNRWLTFSYLFYFFSIFFLLRFDNVKDLNIVTDRFMYLPSLGFCFLFGFGVQYTGERLKNKSSVWKMAAMAVLVILFVGLSVKTVAQIRVWKNSVSLWTHVLNRYPNAALAYYNRGQARDQHGEFLLAIADYTKAIEMNSSYAAAYNNRGVDYKEQKMFDLAIQDYAKALAIDPGLAESYNNRGIIYKLRRQYEAAIKEFNQALILNPNYVEAYNNRGNAHLEQGQYELAIADYNRAIAINPQYTKAYLNRSVAYKGLENLSHGNQTIGK